MTDYKCLSCKTVWKNALPVSKHQGWDESKHHTVYTGKGSCTCSVGSDGLQPQ